MEVRLAQQSSRREDLVRQHFGLFIHCVEGLEWLKAFKGDNNPGAGMISLATNQKGKPARFVYNNAEYSTN